MLEKWSILRLVVCASLNKALSKPTRANACQDLPDVAKINTASSMCRTVCAGLALDACKTR